MSLKASTFASIIGNPMNTYNFEVVIPGIDYTAVVQSTTFPSQGETRGVSLYYQGEEIQYPSLPKNGGEWSFTLPESSSAIFKQQFDDLAKSMYNQKTGIATPTLWKKVQIFCKDYDGKVIFSGILHGCWLRKRNDIGLDASKPDAALIWEYTLHYTWFEDGNINPAELVASI